MTLESGNGEYICSHTASLGLCHYRYRSGGGKSQNQLTVNELRQFVTQLYALPCVLSQTPLLKVTTEGCVSEYFGNPVFCK